MAKKTKKTQTASERRQSAAIRQAVAHYLDIWHLAFDDVKAPLAGRLFRLDPRDVPELQKAMNQIEQRRRIADAFARAKPDDRRAA